MPTPPDGVRGGGRGGGGRGGAGRRGARSAVLARSDPKWNKN